MSIIFTPILDVDMEIMNRLDEKSVYTMFLVNKFINKIILNDPSEYNSLYYKLITYKHRYRILMENFTSVTWICKYNIVNINLQTHDDLDTIQSLIPMVHDLKIHPYKIFFKTSSNNVIDAIEKIVLYHGKNFKINHIHCFNDEIFYDDTLLNYL